MESAARGSVPRRLFAWLVDYGIVMALAVAVVAVALVSVVQSLPRYVGGVAGIAGWQHVVPLITHHGHAGGGVLSVAADEWLDLILPLLAAFAAVPVLQFVYQASLLRWRGRTIGKAIADIRVVSARVDPSAPRPAVLRRALITTVLETGLGSFTLIMVTLGQFSIALLVCLVAIVAFWVNLIVALGPRRRSLVDRLAGTTVVRAGLYAKAAQRTRELAQSAPGVASTAGRATLDAAAVAAQLTRERAEAVAQSKAVQQAQALGTAGAERARRIGGRAQQLWEERRARRTPAGDVHRPD